MRFVLPKIPGESVLNAACTRLSDERHRGGLRVGSYGIIVAILLLVLLAVQGVMLWCFTRYARSVRQEKEERQKLTKRLTELAEDFVALQKETNRLLKRIVFEEHDNDHSD